MIFDVAWKSVFLATDCVRDEQPCFVMGSNLFLKCASPVMIQTDCGSPRTFWMRLFRFETKTANPSRHTNQSCLHRAAIYLSRQVCPAVVCPQSEAAGWWLSVRGPAGQQRSFLKMVKRESKDWKVFNCSRPLVSWWWNYSRSLNKDLMSLARCLFFPRRNHQDHQGPASTRQTNSADKMNPEAPVHPLPYIKF